MNIASEISVLLKEGWKGLWKNNALWLLGSLVLIDPILRLIAPLSKNESLLLALLNLFLSLAYFYLLMISDAGICFVAYCVITQKPVDFETAFRASHDLFWRVVAISFLLLLLIVPFAILLAFFIGQLANVVDFNRSIAYALIPFSAFTAMSFFPITEIIAHDTKVFKSLRIAWTVFTQHFPALAVTGLLLRTGLYLINLFISMAILLLQSHFDLSVIGALDWISPPLSFPYNSIYRLIMAIPQVVWMVYGASVFTFAYIRYKNAGMRMKKAIKG